MNKKIPPKLISYVLDHDTGFAPNPFFGKCILSHCKYSVEGKRENVIELAEKGTWIVGTGGSRLKKRGKLIYAMRVAAKVPIRDLFRRREFAIRRQAFGYKIGCGEHRTTHGDWMLISNEFYYYGENAIRIPKSLKEFQNRKSELESLEKCGPSHKSRFSDEFLKEFEQWIRKKKPGRNGLPHNLNSGTKEFLEAKGEL